MRIWLVFDLIASGVGGEGAAGYFFVRVDLLEFVSDGGFVAEEHLEGGELVVLGVDVEDELGEGEGGFAVADLGFDDMEVAFLGDLGYLKAFLKVSEGAGEAGFDEGDAAEAVVLLEVGEGVALHGAFLGLHDEDFFGVFDGEIILTDFPTDEVWSLIPEGSLLFEGSPDGTHLAFLHEGAVEAL